MNLSEVKLTYRVSLLEGKGLKKLQMPRTRTRRGYTCGTGQPSGVGEAMVFGLEALPMFSSLQTLYFNGRCNGFALTGDLI